jgi:hypothetical protein
MFPSRAAVLDLVGQFGYRAAVLRPHFTSYEGAADFRSGERRAFVCAKTTGLDAIRDVIEADEGPRQAMLDVPARVLAQALWTKLLRRLGLEKREAQAGA